jgi:hypothetical protein
MQSVFWKPRDLRRWCWVPTRPSKPQTSSSSNGVSFVIEGDVAAVRSAIDAGNEAASKAGEVLSQLVIPRPDDALEGTLNRQG